MNDARRRRFVAALAALPAAASFAADTEAGTADDGWAALAAGGAAVLLRHAQTEPGIGDPPGYRLDDCGSQRNLSAAGRAQAARIGARFRARAVKVDLVRSSRWCRCLDTARLAFPAHAVEPMPALDSFFDARERAPQQSAAVRGFIAALGRRNAVLVTHMVNIAALAGAGVAMGEAVVLRADAGGELQVAGRLVL